MVENCSLITVAEAKSIEAEVDRICHEYNVPNVIEVEISKRMRLKAGCIGIKLDRSLCSKAQRIKHAQIKLSYDHYREFGFERMMKTLKHEMAHFINYIVFNGRNHDTSFKKLCVKFGGTMNEKMAGSRYAEAATAEYCKRKSGYRYTCPKCGSSHERTRPWAPEKANRRCCTKCKTSVSVFMMEEF